MCKLRGRKAKAQQTSQLHPGQLLFSKEERRAALCGIRTHDTLQSRRVLYKYTYSHIGNGYKYTIHTWKDGLIPLSKQHVDSNTRGT